MVDAALSFVAVTKDYRGDPGVGRIRALDGFSAEVNRGHIVGLLGPNGCGKSTALKCALGLTQVQAGGIEVGGHPAGGRKAQLLTGYMPERAGVSRYLTGREALNWWARLTGSGSDRAGSLLAAVGLEAAADRRVGTFSKGMLQRLALAQALLPRPQVLLLDEPFSGVDPLGIDRLAEVIRSHHKSGMTVLLTSHLLQRVEEICDEVILLHRGRVVAAGAVAEVLGGPVERRRGLDDVFRERLQGGQA